MKALLLSAGLGKRLLPLTKDTPKCLIEINNISMIERWITSLQEIGIRQFRINTHYLSKKVDDFIGNSIFSECVTISYEENLLGTAGSFIQNIEFFEDGDALVLHTDNYTNIDIAKMAEAHENRPEHCDITIASFITNSPSSCGILEINKFGVVEKIHEKAAINYGNVANSAIMMFSQKAIIEIKNLYSSDYDLCGQTLLNFENRIYTYHHSKIFIDIGTPRSLALARSIAKKELL